MRDKGLGFDVIKEVLNNPEGTQNVPVPSVPVMSQSEAIQTIQNLQQTIQDLSYRMESIIQENVEKEVLKLSEALNQQQEYIEQSLKSRDEQLMKTL